MVVVVVVDSRVGGWHAGDSSSDSSAEYLRSRVRLSMGAQGSGQHDETP